jgi:hypothetical protein
MARTALYARKQPGGVYTLSEIEAQPGNVFFVHSGTGTDSEGYGQGPDSPVATIDYAIGLCTASKGDVIYVLPGHAENITTATGINCDVAGVSIIGLGKGNLKPTVTATAAAGSVTVAAANVTLKNLRLVSNFATGCTSALTVAATGDGLTLDGIECRDGAANKEWLIHVSVATTVTDMLITRCSFVGLTGESMTNSILFAGTSTDCVIEDSYFFVDSSDDVIDHLTGASVNLTVRRCVVINADTDAAGYCLRYKSDGTGIAHDNRFAYNKIDAEVSVGAAAWWIENYASNTIAQSGLLDPATSHAIP